MASAGLTALGRHRLPGGIAVGTLFDWSFRIGTKTRRLRDALRGRVTEKGPIPEKAPETGKA